jgi:prepilin signal peptidase PulO-like enzyme (type II secretory pathway)
MLIHDLQSLPDWFIQLALVIVSACVGSFINVVVYRLPQTILANPNFSLLTTRSFCPLCRKKIHWHDNIPIFSYLILKGKCRSCDKKIAARYFLLELITILMSLLIYQLMGLHHEMFVGILLSWCLLPMFVIDIEHYLLPDQLTLSLLWLGLLVNLHGFFTPLSHAVIGAIIGYCLLWAIDSLYFLIRKKNGIGQGDWKLLAALGAWFGAYSVFYLLAIAAILATLCGIAGLLAKKLKLHSQLPFGPFLCIAAWIFLFSYRHFPVG